ncbi:RNA polymerase sigma-70 factor [soil metagenome]
MNEVTLLQELKNASPKAVREWYRVYYSKLHHFISGKVVTGSDAEELTQDVFLSCLKHLPLFRGESSIWTWMLHIAQHEVADYYRKRYAKKFILALPLSEFLPIEPIQHADEVSAKVMTVLQRMKHEHRELLLMKYLDKKKVAQIAEETGRSTKSVESLLFRARDEFRELYGLETT